MPLDDVLLELKDKYHKDLPEMQSRLSEMLQKEDYEGIYQEVHKLKGTGSTYGFPEVTELATVLETLSRQTYKEKSEDLHNGLRLLEKIHKSHEQSTGLTKNFNLFENDVFTKLKQRVKELDSNDI